MLEKVVKTNQFKSVGEMRERVAFLEDLKNKQEDRLKFDLIEIYKSLQPAELVKSAIDNIRQDQEVRFKAAGLVGSLSLNYIVGRIAGKNKGPMGYIRALVIQQIVSYLYRKNEKNIQQFLGKISRKALRKMHVIEEEPFDENLTDSERKLLEKEREENQEFVDAVIEDREEKHEKKKEKIEKEPEKNKSLYNPTSGPGKTEEEG
jgi:hypothetical protein